MQKIKIFGIDIDQLTMHEAICKINTWVQSTEFKCKYIVTPNVDHIITLKSNHLFFQAYQKASLVLVDGKPVFWASKLLGKPLKEVVSGSDLVPAIFDFYQKISAPVNVFLLGSKPGVPEKATKEINKKWPAVNVVGVYSPSFGFENSEQEAKAIKEKISAAKPDIVIFGVGSPKQELWASKYSMQINAKVLLCVGATIDFIAGEQIRAPILLRNLGLEWLYRLVTNPKRLYKRYLKGLFLFPKLVFLEWKLNNNSKNLNH